MIYLQSLVFNILFFIWTAMIVCRAMLGLVLGQRYVTRSAYHWGLGTHRLLKWTLGIEYEIRGQEHWDGNPALFACKHESVLETTMIQVLAFNSSIILKRELTWIPFFGQVVLKAGVIPIDRAQGKKVFTQIVAGARHFIAKGRPLFVFPEGTRKPVNVPTQLRAGIGILYEDLNLPVYPIALNTGSVWGRRQFLKRPGKVIYEILPPIAPGLSKEVFLKTLTDQLEEKTLALRAEAALWKPAPKSPFKKNVLGVLTVLCMLALGAYSFAWIQAKDSVEDFLKSFQAHCAQKGMTFSYAPPHVSGYPFHLRAQLSQVSLRAPGLGTLTFGNAVTLEGSVFSPKVFSLSSPSLKIAGLTRPFVLTTGQVQGTFDVSHASERDFLPHKKLVLKNAHLTGFFKDSVTARELDLGLAETNGATGPLFSLSARQVKSDLLPVEVLEELVLDLEFAGAPGTLSSWDALRTWPRWPGSENALTTVGLSLKALPLDLKADATLTMDEQEQLEGAASLYLKGVDPFLDSLVDRHKLSFLAAQGYKFAFALATSFAKEQGVEARGDQVPVSLSLQKGQLFLGKTNLGAMPPLVWPAP